MPQAAGSVLPTGIVWAERASRRPLFLLCVLFGWLADAVFISEAVR